MFVITVFQKFFDPYRVANTLCGMRVTVDNKLCPDGLHAFKVYGAKGNLLT